MARQNPKINIRYNRFLDPVFLAYVRSFPKWENWVPPSKEEVLKRVENYKKEWSLYEKDILEGMSGILELEFKQNIIDVHIVSGNPRQFSRPIIIKSGFQASDFVDVLTHELIHALFSQNSDSVPLKILSEMFPGENNLTRNHIITHAVLKYIYLDVLKDESRLNKNIKRSLESSKKDYTKAWQIVEKIEYKELINGFKEKIKMTPVH